MRYTKIILALALFGFSLSASSQNCQSPTMDGYTYSVVEIGDQCWFAENLRTTVYADGTAIPEVTDDTAWAGLSTGARCDYDNDAGNVSTYGRLYNKYAVDDSPGLCPAGWHVPTDGEWTELEDFITSQGFAGTEGTALKSTTGWLNNGNGTDDFGFSALPGGYRNFFNGLFHNAGLSGNWWSSSPNGGDAWYRRLTYIDPVVVRLSSSPRFGFSIRCLRDAEASTECTDPDACNFGTNTVDEICLSLEEVTFHDGTIPELGGMTTYRLYLNFPDDGTPVQHTLTGVSSQPSGEPGSDPTNTVEITTTTSFYQDALGSTTSSGINPILFPSFPSLEYDSWISLGGTNQDEGNITIIDGAGTGWQANFDNGGDLIMPTSETGSIYYTIPEGAGINFGTSLLLGQFTTNGTIDAKFYRIDYRSDLDGDGVLESTAEGGSSAVYNLSLANNQCTSVAIPCVYADPGLNCDGTCINDTDSDGICDEFEVAGCQDVDACNFNSDATDSDPSACDYDCVDSGGFVSVACENETSVDYNGQTYSLVEIDGRCWFAEDLRTTSYNNGNPIDIVTDEVTWAALTEADGPKSTYLTDGNGQVYRSYNWYAVETGLLCPSGWHVANNADWNSLEKEAFNARPNKLSRRSNMVLGNVQGLHNLGWFDQYNQSNVFESSGFSGGLRENVSGKWREAENSIYWWTFEDFTPRSNEVTFRFNSAWARGVMADGAWERSNALWSTSNNKNNALRVRCVKGGVETGGLPEGSFYSVYISPGATSVNNYDVGLTYNVGDTLYQDSGMQNPYSYGFKVSNDYGERLVTDRNGVLILDPDTLSGAYGGGGAAIDPQCAYCLETYNDGSCYVVEKCAQNSKKDLAASEICAQFDLPVATVENQGDCSWGVWVGADQEKIAKYELTSKLARIGYRLRGEGKSLDGTRVDIIPFDVESKRRKENTVSFADILRTNHFIQVNGLYFRFDLNNGEDFLRLEISPLDEGATLPQSWDDINIFTQMGLAKPGELCSCYEQVGTPPACSCYHYAYATTRRYGTCPSLCASYGACNYNCCDAECGYPID